MSTKKRFTIAPELASGLRNTIQSASTNQGQLHYDMMSVDAIELDPENPRKLSITQYDIAHGLNPTDPHYQIKQADFAALSELAESIKRIGIRNAIEVYKEGQKYRIISGERRYLATLLLGLKSIPARINTKPDEFNLRYMQWVENINRQDLSLREKYNNLIAMMDAYQRTHAQAASEKTIQELLGVSPSHAYRYFCLLNAEQRVIDLVKAGKLNNLKIVQELVSMKDKKAKEQILSWIHSSHQEVTSLAKYKTVTSTNRPKTRKATINLGKVHQVNIAKYVFNRLLSDVKFHSYQDNFKNVDWSSVKSIEKAFQSLFKAMENELNTEEA